MPTVYDLKPAFQGLLRPIVGTLARMGVTANQVTFAAALMSVVYGLAMPYLGRLGLLLLSVVLFVRMALNAIDGMLAREHNMKSRLGAILNELGDVISDAGLYLPLAWMLGAGAFLPIALGCVVLALCEFAGVLGQVVGQTRRYDGPMGKSDRAVAYGATALVAALIPASAQVVIVLLWLIVVMGAYTTLRRCSRALAETPNSTDAPK